MSTYFRLSAYRAPLPRRGCPCPRRVNVISTLHHFAANFSRVKIDSVMRVAIVGNGKYSPLKRVRGFVRSLPAGTTVISGGAQGVDEAAANEARLQGLKLEIWRPDFKKYGVPAAYSERNSRIARRCDCLIVFWDRKTRGTANVMEHAFNFGKRVLVNPRRWA